MCGWETIFEYQQLWTGKRGWGSGIRIGVGVQEGTSGQKHLGGLLPRGLWAANTSVAECIRCSQCVCGAGGGGGSWAGGRGGGGG